MKMVLAGIGLIVILFVVANVIGAAMWSLADQMEIWWDHEEDN